MKSHHLKLKLLMLLSLVSLNGVALGRSSDSPCTNSWVVGTTFSGPANGITLVKPKAFEIIDTKGRTVSNNRFDSISEFCNGAANVLQNGKYGLVDRNGQFLIKPNYKHLGALSNNLVLFVEKNSSNAGFLDRFGLCKIEPKYRFAKDFSNGYAGVVEADSKWHIMDTRGELRPIAFELCGLASEGLIPVKRNGKWGFVTTNGEEKIACKYAGAKSFKNGLAPVQTENGQWGFVDRENNLKIPFSFAAADEFSEALARVEMASGECFFIDSKGIKRLGPYSQAGRFGNGIAPIVGKNGSPTYIARSGKTMDLGSFTCVSSFRDGRAFVIRDNCKKTSLITSSEP